MIPLSAPFSSDNDISLECLTLCRD